MRTFRYDPGKTFRGWLRRLCQSRAIDLLRKKKADAVQSLEDQPAGSLLQDAADISRPRKARRRNARFCSDWPRKFRTPFGDGSSERTWQVFWNIAVEGQSVRETSEAAGISYYAAFAAQKRVGRMLREEGQRLLAEPRVHEPEVGRTGD